MRIWGKEFYKINAEVLFMIDSHCHLEQPPFSEDRDEIIQKCKEAGLKAVVTCCASPKDFELTMEIVRKHRNFVFATVGIHPEFIKDVSNEEKKDILKKIEQNQDDIKAIGEVGLDKYWIKEEDWLRKQQELFIEMIEFAKKLKKPLVIHSRNAYLDSVEILEKEDAERVLMHMFGDKNLVERVIENGWFISMNAIVLRSKTHRKIIKKAPIEKILLETDAPWLHPSGSGRNDPTSIQVVAEKIAQLKHLDFETVWKQCGKNAKEFFKLPVKI